MASKKASTQKKDQAPAEQEEQPQAQEQVQDIAPEEEAPVEEPQAQPTLPTEQEPQANPESDKLPNGRPASEQTLNGNTRVNH